MAKTKNVFESTQVLSRSSDFVYSDPGDEAVLSCRLDPAISAASMEIRWWNRADLVCHYKNGWVTVNRDFEGRVSLSLEELHNGNVSLTLRDVRRSQRGLYICEVIHGWRSVKENIFLHIRYFRLVTPVETVSADTGSDVMLPVHLSPETTAVSMDIRWSKGMKLIYQFNNRQERTNNEFENRVSVSIQQLERGNLALTLRNTQLSDSGDYTCSVFHDGCLQTGIVHLQVNELQKKKSEDKFEQLQEILGKIQDKIKKTKKTSLTEITEDPASEHSNSTEGIRPLMESESSDQNTRQTREVSTATEQRLTSPDTSSLVLQRERRSPNAIIPMVLERTQESRVRAIEQERSSSAVQSQAQKRERPSESAAGSRTQTPRRPEDRAQRRQRRHERTEKNCQIM